MTKEQSLCDQVKYRLVDFLKAAELPFWEPELTVWVRYSLRPTISVEYSVEEPV